MKGYEGPKKEEGTNNLAVSRQGIEFLLRAYAPDWANAITCAAAIPVGVTVSLPHWYTATTSCPFIV